MDFFLVSFVWGQLNTYSIIDQLNAKLGGLYYKRAGHTVLRVQNMGCLHHHLEIILLPGAVLVYSSAMVTALKCVG